MMCAETHQRPAAACLLLKHPWDSRHNLTRTIPGGTAEVRRADITVADILFHRIIRAVISFHMPDHENLFMFLCRGYHLAGFLDGVINRLLDYNMLSRFQGFNGGRGSAGARKAK